MIIFLFLLNISWRTLLIKRFFWMRYILCSFSLLGIDLRISVVIHSFSSACGNPLFLTILCAQKNLKGCFTWALLSKSADWVACYAKYVIFKDTSWTEILHVVAEFHSTFLHGRTVSPHLMEKNEWVCLICIEGRPSLMKIKAGFYIKKLFWKLLWGDGYKEKFLKIWKKKIQKIAVKR